MDFAAVRNIRRGGRDAAISAASDITGASTILEDLRRDRDAASGRNARISLIKTWTDFHLTARQVHGPIVPAEPLPLTPIGLEYAASFFKAGGYRSYPNYLSAMRIMHIEHGHDWTAQLDIMARWTTRSVLRSIGPARQSQAFNLAEVVKLQRPQDPLVTDGPKWPLEAVLLGSVFLLREAELAAAKANHLTFDDRAMEVTWSLASSKSDPQALGTSRTWGCLCGIPTLPCPFHLAKELLSKSMLWAEDEGCTLAETFDLPFFPTAQKGVATKAKYVETFEKVASLTGARTLSLLRVCGSLGATRCE
jgi:hypothetical protein